MKLLMRRGMCFFLLFFCTLIFLIQIIIHLNDQTSFILSHDDFEKEIFSKRVDLSLTIDDYDQDKIFRLNPVNLCKNSNETPLFTAFVIIAPDSFHKRQLIRATWANKTLFSSKVKVIFVIGLPSSSSSKSGKVNEEIDQEFSKHQDILQLNFVDSYYKITKKVMLSFKWIHTYCSQTKYILRINEDVFVNTFELIRFFDLSNIPYKSRQIYGWLVKNFTTNVNRKENTKFYVAHSEYACAQYPDYPSGSFFFNLKYDLKHRTGDPI